LEHYKKERTDSCCSDTESSEDEDDKKLISDPIPNCSLKFEILTKKYEVPELCQIFFHRYVKYFYLGLQTMLFFLVNWTYTTVSASSWATNIPFQHLHPQLECTDQAFLHDALPGKGCLFAYYISITLFGIIVVSISLLNLREQAYVQLIFGFMKVVTIVALVAYCLYHLIKGGDACSAYEENTNQTLSNIPISSLATKFNLKGWVQSFSVFIFGYVFQTGIPSLIQPIRQKKFVHWLILANVVILSLAYTSMGVALSLWFRAAVQETSTLNWVRNNSN